MKLSRDVIVPHTLMTLNPKPSNFFSVDANYSDGVAGAFSYFCAKLLRYLFGVSFSENATASPGQCSS
jgi:hypothetical protein